MTYHLGGHVSAGEAEGPGVQQVAERRPGWTAEEHALLGSGFDEVISKGIAVTGRRSTALQ
jgi:hypothetical protein